MQKETLTEWPIDKKHGICRPSLMTLYWESVLGSGMTTQLLFKLSGYIVPNFLSAIMEAGEKVATSDIQRGDVVIFSNNNLIPHYLSVYLGNAGLLELRGKVTIRPFDPSRETKNNSLKNQVHKVINLFPA